MLGGRLGQVCRQVPHLGGHRAHVPVDDLAQGLHEQVQRAVARGLGEGDVEEHVGFLERADRDTRLLHLLEVAARTLERAFVPHASGPLDGGRLEDETQVQEVLDADPVELDELDERLPERRLERRRRDAPPAGRAPPDEALCLEGPQGLTHGRAARRPSVTWRLRSLGQRLADRAACRRGSRP